VTLLSRQQIPLACHIANTPLLAVPLSRAQLLGFEAQRGAVTLLRVLQ